MNEWLAIMLEEIDRKKVESEAAREEAMRRLTELAEKKKSVDGNNASDSATQSR